MMVTGSRAVRGGDIREPRAELRNIAHAHVSRSLSSVQAADYAAFRTAPRAEALARHNQRSCNCTSRRFAKGGVDPRRDDDPGADQGPGVGQVAEAEIADDHRPEQQGVGERLDDGGRRQLQGA